MKVGFAGREIDLSGVLPLRLGDWKVLERQGVTSRKLQDEQSLEAAATFILYVLRKADANVTEAEVEALSMNQATDIMAVINNVES
jgi:hypothetical protein